MADKATGNLTASILSDVSKMSIGSSLSYEPVDSGDKWVYTERLIGITTQLLIPSTQPYIEKYSSTGAQTTVHADDEYRWLAIKHTGTKDGTTVSTEGIVLSLNGNNAAFNYQAAIFIELWIGKFPSDTTQADISAISVAVTNGSPSGAGGSVILCQIAAILDDVA